MIAKTPFFFLFGFSALLVVDCSCPYGYTLQTMDATAVNTILSLHNSYRQSVANGSVAGQPKALLMPNQTWDNSLSAGAFQCCTTCTFSHYIVSNSNYSAVGQNLYMTMSTALSNTFNWNSAVTSWFNEYKSYTFGPISSNTTGPVTGHYTQLVWANSVSIGCGAIKYYDNSTYPSYPYITMYACNYGPAGNYIGQTPYTAV